MRHILTATLLILVGLPANAIVRYVYTGANYGAFDPFPSPFTPEMRVSGWFEVDEPIGDSTAFIGPILDWEFSNGIDVISPETGTLTSGPQLPLVFTAASGEFDLWSFIAQDANGSSAITEWEGVVTSMTLPRGLDTGIEPGGATARSLFPPGVWTLQESTPVPSLSIGATAPLVMSMLGAMLWKLR